MKAKIKIVSNRGKFFKTQWDVDFNMNPSVGETLQVHFSQVSPEAMENCKKVKRGILIVSESEIVVDFEIDSISHIMDSQSVISFVTIEPKFVDINSIMNQIVDLRNMSIHAIKQQLFELKLDSSKLNLYSNTTRLV